MPITQEDTEMLKTISLQFKESTAAAIMDKNKAPSALCMYRTSAGGQRPGVRVSDHFLTPQGNVLPSRWPSLLPFHS